MHHGLRKGLCLLISYACIVVALMPVQAADIPLKVGSSYSGFELIEQQPIKDNNMVGLLFRHVKSGAQLLYLQNEDDNKVFSIAFRTIPTDSTGVAHILEHSVLDGSEKFPAKAPFLELKKSSLYTFLNAMTSSDKTRFPVASRNNQDFRNLINVYMDAVLHPRIYQQPEIFMQEGWHYQLANKNAPITYNGVVYSEMKGVYSNPARLLSLGILASLFPDTIYKNSSGGDPEHIPDLTREAFLAFHQKYYHPSNSYIFLYGKLDIFDTLQFLDKEYLNAYDQKAIDTAIASQQSFAKLQQLAVEYPVAVKESTKDKTYLSMNFVINQAKPEAMVAFSRLGRLLTGSADAPLKKALMEAGLGKQVSCSFSSSLLQPVFSIIVANANPEQKAQFEKIVTETLAHLAEQGFDEKLLQATDSNTRFWERASTNNMTHAGLAYNDIVLAGWLYGSDPLVFLSDLETAGKKPFANEYFKKIIKEELLHNLHASTVIATPHPGMQAEKAQAVHDKLATYKASLSEGELEALVQQTAELKKWQKEPDTPEVLEKIPALSLKDVESKKTPEKTEAGVKVLSHELATNKIVYMDLLFDTTSVPQEQLPYLYLLAEVLGKLSTDKYKYSDLATAVKDKTGGIGFQALAYGQSDNDAVFFPKLKVLTAALEDNLPETMNLAGEIIAHSKFDDKERLKQVLDELKSQRERQLSTDGSSLAIGRALSYISPLGKYRELNGLSFYQFISNLLKEYPDKSEEISKNLAEVANLVFNQDRLIVSFTAEKSAYPKFQASFSSLLNYVGRQKPEKQRYNFALAPQTEGLKTASKVQYVAKALNYRQFGYEYSGKMEVLETILNNDYLWKRVRVEGGAYGASFKIARNGLITFASLRDPNLTQTIKVFEGTADYLQQFDVSERAMSNYIIATIRRISSPQSVYDKGNNATNAYITKLSMAERQRVREEILATTPDDIRRFAHLFNALKGQQYVCVVGNEQIIEENRAYFGNLVNVME